MNRFPAVIGVGLLLALGAAVAVPAQEPETGPDRVLSPYFLVKGEDPGVDAMPLLSTRADVQVAGVIADVQVTQVYTNAGRKPIEAVYVFPGSTRAAVYGMRMTIGTRTLVAEIQERSEARETYEHAKNEGRSASLLEQQRPNVFQMNVANILPGDSIQVELRYTETLVPTDGIYEFVYPTVVGPRYSNQPEATAAENDRWIQNPYQHEGETPSYGFDIVATLHTGVPIRDVACATHKVAVRYPDTASARVTLDPAEGGSGNRDFILRYRLAGEQVASGLLLYQGADENFFMLTVQPPQRVTLADIPPREYIFIVDVSGSMNGFPLSISKALLRDLIANLRPTDTFNVLLFAGGSALLSERSVPATAEQARKAIAFIDAEKGGGGTELLPALRRALALPRTPGVSRTVVLATDGYVGVEKESFAVVREHLGEANLFAFGIGSSVNRFIIEGLARAGQGEPFVITEQQGAAAQAATFRRYIQSPVLTQIRCDFGDFDTYAVAPAQIPDVMAERPIVLVGKWRGDPRGTVVVEGLAGGNRYRAAVRVDEAAPMAENRALRSLWARQRIAILGDDQALAPDDARVQTITELGLKYGLLTAFTSFVAVDTVIRNRDGKPEIVKQPLPLPQGVSDLAVGGTFAAAAPSRVRSPRSSLLAKYGGGGGGAGLARKSVSAGAVMADRTEADAEPQFLLPPRNGELVLDGYCDAVRLPQGRYAFSHLTRLGYGSVRAFQSATGLAVDGVVGPQTWKAIEDALRKAGLDAGVSTNVPLRVRVQRLAEGKLSVELVNASGAPVTLRAAGSLVRAKGTGYVLILHLIGKFYVKPANPPTLPVEFAVPIELAPGATVTATAEMPDSRTWRGALTVEFLVTDGKQTWEVFGSLPADPPTE